MRKLEFFLEEIKKKDDQKLNNETIQYYLSRLNTFEEKSKLLATATTNKNN